MQAARILHRTALVVALAVTLGSLALAAPAPDAPGGAEPEKWMVNDAEMVVSINIKQMVGSALMKKGGTDALKALINNNEQVKGVLDATGLDPLKDVHSILISGTAASAKDVKALVVIRGKFDLDKVHATAEKFAKKNPDELKLARDDKTNLYQVKVNEVPLFAAFIDSTALVATPTRETTLEAVKNAGKKSVALNKDIKAALEKFEGKESIAIALVVNDQMKKALGGVPQAAEIAPKLQTVTGTINLTDSATTTLTVNTEDAKAGAKVEMLVKQLKALAELMAATNEEVGPIAEELLKALKISRDSGSVTATLKVTNDMIEKANKKKDK